MENTRYKIVLVDDNIATLNQGKSLLQAIYRVFTVQSAELLFEYLEHDYPDMILLDVEMPGMDGFETIQKLKSDTRYKDIPVIFLTAKSDEESERKGFSLGAVDYIAKPFSGPLLQKRISNQILYMRVQSAVKDYSNMIDEVARANERARMLLEKMPFACRLWDRNYQIIECNEAAVKLFGFKDKQEYIDNYNCIYPEFQPDGQRSLEIIKWLIDKAFIEGGFIVDWTYQLKDDTLMPAEVTFVRIEFEGAYVVAAFTRDLRDHEVAQSEMRRAELAEMASLAKTQFLAAMSHEFRTPMNSITGFAELALDSPDESIPPKVRDYLQKILDSSRWFLRIINDILDISKIESGKMELEQRPFDLHDIFSRCQSVIMPEAAEKGLDYRVYLEPVIGVTLIGDPLRLYQALFNLLSNAVKFTEKGMIKMSALAKKTDEGRVSVLFEIQDTGIGIDEKHLDKLFEPFTQADAGTTRTYGGTGLGLSITKNIIELMGGELAVTSELGIGSTFCFELEFDTVDASKSSELVQPAPVDKPTFEGLVLVCDDNPLNREVICEHLARIGLKTVIAENGGEGVDIVRERMEKGEKPFDIIFMDIFMPVMDGTEAASQIIKLGVKTPIVAVTANIMSGEFKKYKEHGMRDCLNKPFTPRELWDIILKYLTPVKIITDTEHDWEVKIQRRLKISFVRNSRNLFDNIAKAIADNEIKAAHRLVHSLKSNAGQIGEKTLMDTAREAERLLKDGLAPNVRIMTQLRNELAQTINKLEPLLSEPAGAAPPPTPERIKELYGLLLPMLKNKNTECEDLLDEIRTIPGADILVRQIEEFDYSLAEITLEELMKA